MIEGLLSEGGVALARWMAFAGTSLAVGTVVLRRVSPADCPTARVHGIARTAGALLLLSGVLRMTQQALLFAPTPGDAGQIVGVLRGTPWGFAWQLQLLVGGVLVASPRLVAGPRPAVVGTLVALGGAIVPAFQGHAFGSERWTVVAVIADSIHVLAGGIWLGTLAVLTLATFRRSDVDVAATVARFSPLALVGAGALGITGTFGAWLHITPVSALWQSPYGLMLVRKLVVFAGILALGAVNWKRLTPRLHETSAGRGLRRSATVEVLLGALLLLLTAYLVATPLPGE